MTINILIIDDDQDKIDDLEIALDALKLEFIPNLDLQTGDQNLSQSIGHSFFSFNSISDPGSIRTAGEESWTEENRRTHDLIINSDIILLDVLFDGQPMIEQLVNRIDAIIETSGAASPLLIAWTQFPEDALNTIQSVIGHQKIDRVWDKSTANPEYVSWRLRNLVNVMLLDKPNMVIRSLIHALEAEQCPPWHLYVLEQLKTYSSTGNEHQTIEYLTNSIQKIGTSIGGISGPKITFDMWDKIMCPWEMIERASIKSVRGHVRHVVNVYWLGYFLINHPGLKEAMFPEKYVSEMEGSSAMEGGDPFHEINAAWFLSGVFHDIGNCVAKQGKLSKYLQNIFEQYKPTFKLKEFGDIKNEDLVKKDKDLVEKGDDLFDILASNSLALKQLLKLWETSIENETPDSGIAGSIFIADKLSSDSKWRRYSKLACPGIAAHNQINKLDHGTYSWEKEPISCLLILCDQIQTWDRSRGDENPTRDIFKVPCQAELLDIKVTRGETDRKPRVAISINYITSTYASNKAELRSFTSDGLIKILQDFPLAALNKLGGEWPFDMTIGFFLNMEPLNVSFSSAS